MWRRIGRPEVLVFLDASFEACTRRKRLDWLPREYEEQQRRLAHARVHCHVFVATDALTPEDVLRRVLDSLGEPDRATAP